VYNWIRDKYDLKKYAPRGMVSPVELLAQGQDPSVGGSRNQKARGSDRDRSSSGEQRDRRMNGGRSDRSSSGERRCSHQQVGVSASPSVAGRPQPHQSCEGRPVKHQVESFDLLGGFEEDKVEPAAVTVVADNWAAFPSELQQPTAAQQQQPQQVDCFAEQFGNLCFDSNGSTQPPMENPSPEMGLPTLLTNRPKEPHNNKVEDVQKSLASLYSQPQSTDNRFSALAGMQQFGGVPQTMGTHQGMQHGGVPQMMGTQQFGGPPQTMGTQQGMQQFGGMPQMMGTPASLGMQQFGGMQQTMGMQQFAGMQQFGSAHQMMGMHQFAGVQQTMGTHQFGTRSR
jgi:hypothetical protein